MKTLISCDYSPAGKYVLAEAQKFLTQFSDAEIHVLSVLDMGVISSAGMYNNGEVIKALEEQANEIKQWAENIFAGKHVHFFTEVGYAADVISRQAAAMHVDLLILGTHGKTGLNRMIIGSVAESVLRHTSCKTLIIPVKHVKED